MAVLAAPRWSVVAGARSTSSRSGALLTWRRLSLLSTCAAVAFLPFLIPAGPGNLSPVDVFIVLSIGTTVCWALSDRLSVRAPYLIPVSVIALAGAIAALFSVYPGNGLLAVAQDLLLLAWSTTVVTVCRTPRGMAMVLRTWAYASVVWALLMTVGVLGNVAFLSGETAREGVRASITFGDPNMAAGYYCSSLMVVWAARTPRNRAARWATCVLLVLAVTLTGSNGFSIATAAACFTAAVIGVARRRGVLASVVMACIVLLGTGAVVTRVNLNSVVSDAAASAPLLRDYVGRFTQTTAVREDLLQETLSLTSEGGLIGIGPNAVKSTLQAQQRSVAFEAHSDYTASIVERGVLGGVGLLMLLLTVALFGRAALGRVQPAYAAVVARPGAFVGALIAFAIAADIYELLHFRYVWTLLAVVAALSIWGREAAAA